MTPATKATLAVSPPDALMLPLERVAERLCGVCVRTVERLAKRNEFPPPRKRGRRTLWPRAVVETWVNDPDAARKTLAPPAVVVKQLPHH